MSAEIPSSPFMSLPSGDRAQAWIDLLFLGHNSTDGEASYTQSLVTFAEALRHALGLYNVAILVVGAFLLFYHIVSMIAETAQEGTVLGRRANKVWAPIRLVVAVSLLVPVAGGLSAGQYLIVKIAEAGSTLASNAWQTIVATTHGSLATLVAPRTPNISALVVTATEMELCRSVYQSTYAQALRQSGNDPSYQLLGTIDDITKLPAGRLQPEIWRYSNGLNADIPICGEYHFAGYRSYDVAATANDGHGLIEHAAMDLQAFAHAETNNLILQADSLAGRVVPAFLNASSSTGVDIHNDLATLSGDLQSRLNAQLKSSGVLGGEWAGRLVDQVAAGGWFSAASMIPEMMRLQESYGEIVAHALPEAVEPLLEHPLPARQELADAFNLSRPLAMVTERPDNLLIFYAGLSKIMVPISQWIKDGQLPKGFLVPASGLDLRDHLTIASDSSLAFGMFAVAIDARAIADGVWGIDDDSHDAGNPFASSTFLETVNPFTVLAEFGRRQYRMGTYLLGLSGSVLTIPGALAPAALTALVAVALFAGGLVLIFVVPFLPFLRFMIAALVWMLNLFEAVVAMPIVALAHLTPNGEGLSGGAARQAYRLWLALMIRPLLTLAGLAMGFLLLAIGLGFLMTALSPFAHGAALTNSSLLIVANLALVLLFDVFAYVAVNAAFKGITWLPDQALRWISPFVVTEDRMAEILPVAASAAGTPNVTATAAVTNLISSPGGAVNISAGASTSISEGGKSVSHSQGMKAALFPLYHHDKSIADHSMPSMDVPPVNLTSPSVTVQVGSLAKDKKTAETNKASELPDGKKLPVTVLDQEIKQIPEQPPKMNNNSENKP